MRWFREEQEKQPSPKGDLGDQRERLLAMYSLVREGFDSDEVDSLITARELYLGGDLSEWPDDRGGLQSRLRFARWLREHNRISG
jgi:hypothetical protein